MILAAFFLGVGFVGGALARGLSRRVDFFFDEIEVRFYNLWYRDGGDA
jgi:hypothetical protein